MYKKLVQEEIAGVISQPPEQLKMESFTGSQGPVTQGYKMSYNKVLT